MFWFRSYTLCVYNLGRLRDIRFIMFDRVSILSDTNSWSKCYEKKNSNNENRFEEKFEFWRNHSFIRDFRIRFVVHSRNCNHANLKTEYIVCQDKFGLFMHPSIAPIFMFTHVMRWDCVMESFLMQRRRSISVDDPGPEHCRWNLCVLPIGFLIPVS